MLPEFFATHSGIHFALSEQRLSLTSSRGFNPVSTDGCVKGDPGTPRDALTAARSGPLDAPADYR